MKKTKTLLKGLAATLLIAVFFVLMYIDRIFISLLPYMKVEKMTLNNLLNDKTNIFIRSIVIAIALFFVSLFV